MMSDAEVEALKLTIEFHRSWEYRCGILLVAALFGEVALLVWFKEDRSKVEFALATFLAVVVACAVWGEIDLGERADLGYDALERNAELRVAAFGEKASKAEERAAEANERAAAANARAGEANAKAELARLETERVRQANLEQRKLLLPRRLSNQLTPELQALSEFAGMTLVIVTGPPDREDRETADFAFSLGVIDRAGWKVERVTVPAPPMDGVRLWSAAGDSFMGQPARPDDPREKGWAAAEGLRQYLKEETGEIVAHTPMGDTLPGLPYPHTFRLRAQGIEISDRLVVIEVGKRSLDRVRDQDQLDAALGNKPE